MQDANASRLLNCYFERDLKGQAGGVIDEVVWVVDASPEAEQVRPGDCQLHLASYCLSRTGQAWWQQGHNAEAPCFQEGVQKMAISVRICIAA